MSNSGTDLSAPTGLPRGLLILLGAGAAFLVIFGLRATSDIIGPIFLALVLVIAVHPVRGWCERRGLPTWVATFAALIAVYAILVAMVLALVVAGARFAGLLTHYQPEFENLIDDVRDLLDRFGVDDKQIHAMTSSFDLGKVAGIAADLLGGLAGAMSNVFFIVVLLFFMVIDGTHFPGNLSRAPAMRRTVVEAFRNFAIGTRQYLLVATVFGAVVALFDVAALYVLGIPDPWLWGLLAFITNYIPNIGFVIGLVPPAIIAIVDEGVGTAIAVVAVYCALNVVIQTVIQPRVIGNTVGLSGTLSFLSLIVWAWVLGAVGALFAVPLTLFVKALLIDVDPRASWVGPLLAGQPGRIDESESAPPAEAAESPDDGAVDAADASTADQPTPTEED
ncbi:AI-2E family transporter [Solicola gregarius]|uniref:AI-2E family transporter n=1 Tax=Solicola gregarius TaxID=2908642 RepID=A0AA46TDW2_9ACTN|nr:AI-2E family transporter [Solicola gregarius]UYM03517.1 AI-2E family transporter [Solicola gregarius]